MSGRTLSGHLQEEEQQSATLVHLRWTLLEAQLDDLSLRQWAWPVEWPSIQAARPHPVTSCLLLELSPAQRVMRLLIG